VRNDPGRVSASGKIEEWEEEARGGAVHNNRKWEEKSWVFEGKWGIWEEVDGLIS